MRKMKKLIGVAVAAGATIMGRQRAPSTPYVSYTGRIMKKFVIAGLLFILSLPVFAEQASETSIKEILMEV